MVDTYSVAQVVQPIPIIPTVIPMMTQCYMQCPQVDAGRLYCMHPNSAFRKYEVYSSGQLGSLNDSSQLTKQDTMPSDEDSNSGHLNM